MSRGNPDNLKAPQSTEEARRRGEKGGKASGEARAKKKSFRQAFQALLDGKYEIEGNDGKKVKVDGYEAVSLAIFGKAQAGDITAFKELRDTIGEKPKDKVEVSQDKPFEVKITVVKSGAKNN